MPLFINEDTDALIRLEQQRGRNAHVARLILGVGAVVLGASAARVCGGGDKVATIPLTVWTMIAAGLVMLVMGGWLAWRSWPGSSSTLLLRLSGERDKVHNKQARYMLITLIAAIGMLPAAFQASSIILARHSVWSDWVMAILLSALIPGLILGALLNGGGTKLDYIYDEELIQSFRARALGVGYPTAMLVLAALFWLGLFRPNWAVLAAPSALLICVTVPAWTFAWLNLRSER